MCRFSIIDVCKAHRDWFSTCAETEMVPYFPRAALCKHSYFVTPGTKTWCYVMLIQPTKRGRAGEAYWYNEVGLLVARCGLATTVLRTVDSSY